MLKPGLWRFKTIFSNRLRSVLAILILAFGAGGALAQAPSLEQMAGQMIVVGFQGGNASQIAGLARMIGAGQIGGVMYLRTNVKSLANVKAMNAAFMKAGATLPPLIALDQEGGSIERLTKAVGFAEIPSAARVAATKSAGEAEALYAGLARRLAGLGFNVNFGPVADLNINPKNPIIAKYGRAFGRDGNAVSRYAAAFVAGHRKAGVLSALKHFPGHGSSTSDSHAGFVDITRTWSKAELGPYRALTDAGLIDMVMVGHLYHKSYDGGGAGKLPSSLSPDWLEGVLRQDIGFDGVVISDDMEMGAIRKLFPAREAIVRAVEAGVDILLFSNTAKYRAGLGREVRDILVQQAEVDPAFRARVEQSYARIVALKKRLAHR